MASTVDEKAPTMFPQSTSGCLAEVARQRGFAGNQLFSLRELAEFLKSRLRVCRHGLLFHRHATSQPV